ncbi:MAG: hypothetical protein ACREFW_11200 [Rhizomicrobium sp.]
MRFATPPLQGVAGQLMALEAAAGKPGEAKDSAFRVCEKLRQPLIALAGNAGFRALLSRAMALANGKVRGLKAIHVNGQGSLEGLDEFRTTLSPEEIAEGETVLVTRLIELLATFIGETLTLRLIQDIWPQISSPDLNSEVEKDNG